MPMSNDTADLHTLTYRIDPTSLGSVTTYSLGAEFSAAWRNLDSLVKRERGRGEARAAYSYLATALTAVTGQPVRMFPPWELSAAQKTNGTTHLLVTTAPIDPWILTTAVRTFERLSTKHETDTLADLLSRADATSEPLAAHITLSERGSVTAPGWVYDVARWQLNARITESPLLIDNSLPVIFRADTEGNLLAWDQPISHEWPSGMRHATVYLSTKIVTLPGAKHLYLRLDGHVARMPWTWWGVRNVWVARNPSDPLILLPVRGPWPERDRPLPEYRGAAASIVQACDINPIPVLPAEPLAIDHRLARLRGNPKTHPVGIGPGTKFMYQVQGQLLDRLGVPEPAFSRTPLKVGKQDNAPIAPTGIDAAIVCSGAERLRIACLYSTQATRERMVNALATYSPDGVARFVGLPDDHDVALTDRLSIVLHHCPNELKHGKQERDLSSIECLHQQSQHAVAVLAETHYDDANVVNDAKPILRTALGRRGIVVQFLNANYTPGKPRRSETTVADHPAAMAVRDLFRQAGIIDTRLNAAATGSRLKAPLTREATLVGIHLRRDTPRHGANSLVVRLVAVHANPSTEQPWYVEMYDDTMGWLPYGEANARYVTGPLGHTSLDYSFEKKEHLREYIEQALAALPSHKPLVTFAAASPGRSIWHGLSNAGFGAGPYPGSTLSRSDIASVRVGVTDDVLRPTHQSHTLRVNDPLRPNMPGAYLYRHEEGQIGTWLLAQTSHVYRGASTGSTFGGFHTRWTLPDNRKNHIKDDWHSISATEIAIPRRASWTEEELAALTARLCHQSASWIDRTRLPLPLHLAQLPDRGHPKAADDDGADVDSNGG